MVTINSSSSAEQNLDIAIIGMAGRFPGANNLDEFWSNLARGVESISCCSEQEIIDSGFHPKIARDPDFVPAAGKIEGEYMFDADFFGFAPREAQVMDPQHRLLLECSWEALESAGYDPESYSGRIGIYAGASTNTYFPFHVAPNHNLISSIGLLQAITANDKDFLASRVAYKLNLKGPAISVQTACSSSLVAVNLACASLLNYQCDMMLVGGVSVTPKGRLHKDGFIFSRDGHCRPFDEAANGAVFGNGVGVVVLKRLEDALTDGDHIHAVIKGSAVNNDGALKAGYTAPSVTGQMEAIIEAQELSGVALETIRYIEAHGTGTALGDPIEIAALTQAFCTRTNRKGYCAIGSVKGNIGHLDAAAGIAGLIKTALVLEHKQIPATLHFRKPNPGLHLENTPFFINSQLREWKSDGYPCRAAVSSFGFGGTNAHAILEQAPERPSSCSKDNWCLLPISAHSESSMRDSALKLAEFFDAHPAANLEDAAFTLQLGRKHFKNRGFAIANSATEAARILRKQSPGQLRTGHSQETNPSVIFMFPGQGSQKVNMAREIYESEALFRTVVNQCAQLASQYLNRNLIEIIYPQERKTEESENLLTSTEYAQPCLFTIEYALAKLWQSWGIQPTAMIGHSIGEYVAACLAGVLSLEDALKLVCARGASMQEQPAGGMMSIAMSEAEVSKLLPKDLALAAVNAPDLCVVSGPLASINSFQDLVAERGISCRKLRVSHAFHSHMMHSAVLRFYAAFEGIKLSAPKIPFISNVTGDWTTASQACNPEYWVHHLLCTVRFGDGWFRLAGMQGTTFLEVGPGQVLTTLGCRCREALDRNSEILSLASCKNTGSDRAQILTSLGMLWIQGVKVDWNALHHGKTRLRIPLPTYQFQRKFFWLPPVHAITGASPNCEPVAPADQQHTIVDQGNTAVPTLRLKDHELENVVMSIWREALGRNDIKPEDDFFVVGGHSLMAIQMIAEIRRQTGTEITVKALFEQPTAAALARRIRDSRVLADASYSDPIIHPIPRQGNLPLTFHQADVWKFENDMPGTSRYTGVISLLLKGNLVQPGVEFGINQILARHEVLRTTYHAGENGQPVARINPPQSFCIPVKDISYLDAESREQELLDSANRLVRTPFDLSQDTLIRVLLFKTSAIEHLLIFSSHYIAVDGWSVGLILKEFGEYYAAYAEGRPANVPAPHIQCIDYAHWQRSRLSTETIESQLSYWRRQLFNVSSQELVPIDHPRPQHNTMKGSTLHFTLTPDITRDLKQFSHQHGSTFFFTLLSALNILFHSRSGKEDIVIGTITGDRETGMEAVLGSFVNCLPLRNFLRPGQTFLDVLENTRKCTTDAFAHQIPFREIADAIAQHRDLINDPLFRVSLVLRNIPFTEIRTCGLEVQLSPLHVDRGVCEGDLSLYLQEVAGILSGYFEYNSEIFDAHTVERLAGDFTKLLGDVITHPEAQVCDFVTSLEPTERDAYGGEELYYASEPGGAASVSLLSC